jgi:ribonuclease HI
LIEIFTDGLAEPTNPGIGTFGFAVYRDGKRLDTGRGFAGNPVTNNFAEYEGLVAALKRVRKLMKNDHEEIVVYSDSTLLVNQMRGDWKFKRGGYVEKLLEAKELAERFSKLRFKWIPREQNSEADELSRIAYAEATSRKRGRGSGH